MNLTDIVTGFVAFANNIIIPFLMAIALLFFIFNAVRYFVIGAGNDESREKARSLSLYGVLAFVFILVFWGIVNMFSQSAGLARLGATTPNCFDYDPNCLPGNPAGRVVTSTGGNFGIGGSAITTEGAILGNTIGDPRAEGVGGGIGLPENGGDLIDIIDPAVTRIQQPTNIADPATTLDTGFGGDSLAGVTQDTAESPTTLANAVSQTQTVAVDFIDDLDANYDFRIVPIIESSISVINDPEASIVQRGLAATRLNNLNRDTDSGQPLDNDTYLSYINALNAEAKETGGQTLDAASLRNAQGAIPTALQEQINFTNDLLKEQLLDARSGFFVRRSTAQERANEDFSTIMQQQNDSDRIAAFDALVAEGRFPSNDTMDNIRQRLIGDINAERFYQGKAPLEVGS